MNDSYTSSVINPQEMAVNGPETLERKAARINDSAHELDNMLSDIRAKLFGPRPEVKRTEERSSNCLESALDIAIDTLSSARKMVVEILERL